MRLSFPAVFCLAVFLPWVAVATPPAKGLVRTEPCPGLLTKQTIPARWTALLAEKIFYIPSTEFSKEDADRRFRTQPNPIVEEVLCRTPLPGKYCADTGVAGLYGGGLLTREEEQALFPRLNYLKFFAAQTLAKVRAGGQRRIGYLQSIEAALGEAKVLRNAILSANTRLVRSFAKKYSYLPGSASEGLFKLFEVVDHFDYQRGYRFSTYTHRALKNFYYRWSLDHQKGQERSRTTGTMPELVDRSEPGFDLDQQERSAQIAKAMGKLDARERRILGLRHGIGRLETMTLKEVGAEMGLTSERIRVIEKKALEKLAEYLQAEFDAQL
jgi:RNA polymerase sigma factor (sigma-70 family)